MPSYRLALLIGKGLLMRTCRRASVAAAMTLLAVIVTLMLFSFSSTEDSSWDTFSSVGTFGLFLAGAAFAWAALREGEKPSKAAPIVASYWLFVIAVAVLGALSGAKLPTDKVYHVVIPEPAASIYLLVSAACAVCVVAMGFWLVKRDS